MSDTASILNVANGATATANLLQQGGTLKTETGANIIVNDLIEPEILGSIQMNGGNITLNQDAGQFIDMNADVTITDGYITLNGGNGLSFWAYNHDASLTMSGGIMDFTGSGAYVYSSANTLAIDITGGTIKSAGTFRIRNGSFTPVGGTVELYSSADGSIESIYGGYFHNLLIDKSAKGNSPGYNSVHSERDLKSGMVENKDPMANSISLMNDADINGDFVLNSGELNAGNYSIFLAGDWENNVGEAAFIEATSTVVFDGANKADILNQEVFYNLSLDKTNTSFDALELGPLTTILNNLHLIDGSMELNSSTSLLVSGDLTIESGSGLNGNDSPGMIISIGGSWSNNNSDYSTSHGFHPGNASMVTFNGAAIQYLSSSATKEEFAFLTIDKTGGEFKPQSEIYVKDNFSILNGIWSNDVSLLTHSFAGDFTVSATGEWSSAPTNGTAEFVGTTGQDLTDNSTAEGFYKLQVNKVNLKSNENSFPDPGQASQKINKQTNNKGALGTVTLMSDISITSSSYIVDGTLDANNFTISSNGNVYIYGNGKLQVNNNSTLKMGASDGVILEGGMLEAIGATGNMPVIENITGLDYYYINAFSGGTLSAEYAIFRNLDNSGIYIDTDGLIDIAHPLDNCMFETGNGTGISVYLTVNNNQNLVVDGVDFGDLPGGTDSYNVRKTINQGSLSFTNSFGNFAGPAYEKDDFDLIDWGGYVAGLWTGAVSTDWFDGGNWSDFALPIAGVDVLIPAGLINYPEIDGGFTANCQNLSVEAFASLDILSGTLNAVDIEIYGVFDIYTTGTVVVNCSNINYYFFDASGSFSGGTVNIENDFAIWGLAGFQASNANTINFTGAGQSYIVSVKSTNYFENISSIKPSGILSITNTPAGLKINGDLTLGTDNTFETMDYSLIVFGNVITDPLSGIYAYDISTPADVGTIEFHSDYTLNCLLDVGAGDVTMHGQFDQAFDGNLFINGGNLICDAPYSPGFRVMDGDVTMSSGLFEQSNNHISMSGTSSVSGGLIRTGGTFGATPTGAFQPSGGEVEIGCSNASIITMKGGNFFHDLTINGGSGAYIGIESGSLITVNNNCEINSHFDLKGRTMKVGNSLNVGGLLEVDENAVLRLGNYCFVNIISGGTLSAIGTVGNMATLNRYTAGYYYFNVHNGATIQAEYADFSGMELDGIEISSTATVDPAYSFNNCEFHNGEAGGTLLTFNSQQDIDIYGAVFPTNMWGGASNVTRNSVVGDVHFINSSGGFHGTANEDDPFDNIHWNTELELKVYLEGPFNGTEMNTDLDGHPEPVEGLPLSQPYNVAPWFYTGTESVSNFTNPDIVDWVLVELRDSSFPGTPTPDKIVATRAAFLLKDGSVVDMYGDKLLFDVPNIQFDLFVVVHHRNHLSVMSLDADFDELKYSYDFTDGLYKAYTIGPDGHKEIVPGVYGMFAGNGNTDNTIDLSDIAVWNSETGTTGYKENDYNLDTQVDNKDKNDLWFENQGEASQVP
ncbi:MAG: hypothetical protein DRJ05_08520 [Bacteroidetes bacterium]|nr:MAG: hypothetical protein DRJ05_08520 [Bacteroidota bacterium]